MDVQQRVLHKQTFFPPITTSALLTKDLTCSLPQEASIDISVSGGNPPYTYEVSTDGGSSYSPIAGSPYTTTSAGTYQFRITDANGCTQETNAITVTNSTNPSITSVIETQSIACSSEENSSNSNND